MEIDNTTITIEKQPLTHMLVASVWLIAPENFINKQKENQNIKLAGTDTTEELAAKRPDISFETINARAFSESIQKAKEARADFIFMVSQDQTRFGVAIKKDPDNNFLILSSHQAAFILCHNYLKRNIQEDINVNIVKSFLLTNVINTLCDRKSQQYMQINDEWEGIKIKAIELPEAFIAIDENNHVLFDQMSEAESINKAFEYFADIAEATRKRELTMMDRMVELYSIYGFYHDKTFTVTAPGNKEKKFLQNIVGNLRKSTPTEINNIEVRSVNDYANGTTKNLGSGKKTKFVSAQTNIFEIVLLEGTKIAIIPSADYSKVQYNLSMIGSIGNKNDYELKIKTLNGKMLKIIESIGKI